MNAKAAAQQIKPQLTEGSAGVEGSRLLERANQSGAIDQAMQGVKDSWSNAMQDALRLAQTWINSGNPKDNEAGMKYLVEVGKLFAQASNTPRSATQINNYRLPPRKTP